MRKIILLVFGFLMVAQATEKKSDLTPDQALAQLLEGNKRYMTGQSKHAHQGADRRHELEKTQHPFACILSCSDSRVGPRDCLRRRLGRFICRPDCRQRCRQRRDGKHRVRCGASWHAYRLGDGT